MSSELTRFSSMIEFLRTNDKPMKILGFAFNRSFKNKVIGALGSTIVTCVIALGNGLSTDWKEQAAAAVAAANNATRI